LDAVSGVQAPNEMMETYSCSDNPNQVYAVQPNGHFVNTAWGYCVGKCGGIDSSSMHLYTRVHTVR
jgi:hypothetical protein